VSSGVGPRSTVVRFTSCPVLSLLSELEPPLLGPPCWTKKIEPASVAIFNGTALVCHSESRRRACRNLSQFGRVVVIEECGDFACKLWVVGDFHYDIKVSA
jgi:hypothetical protein